MAQNKKAQRPKNGTNSNGSSLGKNIQAGFGMFAQTISHITGRPATFLLALLVVAIWGVTGPLFGFSDTWQLVINTGTTIVTFLMVFLIQNTQNRDTQALQLKIGELIRADEKARNRLLRLEEMSEAEMNHVKDEFKKLHDKVEKKFEEHEHKK